MEQACYDNENIDESQWIPKGEEVVPTIVLKNRHAIKVGERFIVKEVSIVDRLLDSGLIDESHHRTASRLAELCRRALTKQDYTLMRVFCTPSSGGSENPDFCPMTVFQSITRGLRPRELLWIRVLCGLHSCDYFVAASNVSCIRYALDEVEKRMYESRKTVDEVQVDCASSAY